jgi:hypothetical protein
VQGAELGATPVGHLFRRGSQHGQLSLRPHAEQVQRTGPFRLTRGNRQGQLDQGRVAETGWWRRRVVEQDRGGDGQAFQHDLVQREPRRRPAEPHRRAVRQAPHGRRRRHWLPHPDRALGELRGRPDQCVHVDTPGHQLVEEADHPDGVLRVGVQCREPEQQALHEPRLWHPPHG